MGAGGDQTIVVVDDEQSVADAYALRLQQEYGEVRTAYGGEEALETIDGDVDVVLLDRRMPDISGDGVLNELRVEGYDCAVIMVTAVDPSFDITKMGFDDYLCKPVDKEDLFEAVDNQLDVGGDDVMTEYLRVLSKLSVLDEQKPAEELEDSEEYAQLRARASELREELGDTNVDVAEIEQRFQ